MTVSAIRDDTKVTVIIPAYNAAETIGETLNSVSAQTHSNLQVIVVDDGSTDDTSGVVQRHIAGDPRIQLVFQANAGVAQARNHALSLATGAYVAPVDADDLWRPNKIANQVTAMLSRPSPGFSLVYTWYAVIDENGVVQKVMRPSGRGPVLRRLFEGNFVGHASSPLMRTSDVLQVGGYDPTLRNRAAQGCEDWKLYLKLAEIGPFAVIESPLTGYRITPRSMSGNIGQMLRSHRLVMSEYLDSHPDHHRTLRTGERGITRYYLNQALNGGNYKAVSSEVLRISRQDPVLGLYLLRAFSRRLRSRRLQALTADEEMDADLHGLHFLSPSFPPDEEARGRFAAVS